MSRPTCITAYCGHTTTEQYLERQPLGCCATCAKRMDKAETLKRFEEIRHQIKVTCRTCGEEIHPLEQSTLPVAVFWKSITVEKARNWVSTPTPGTHIRITTSGGMTCKRRATTAKRPAPWCEEKAGN